MMREPPPVSGDYLTMPETDDGNFGLLLTLRIAQNRSAVHLMQRIIEDDDADEVRREFVALG